MPYFYLMIIDVNLITMKNAKEIKIIRKTIINLFSKNFLIENFLGKEEEV